MKNKNNNTFLIILIEIFISFCEILKKFMKNNYDSLKLLIVILRILLDRLKRKQ